MKLFESIVKAIIEENKRSDNNRKRARKYLETECGINDGEARMAIIEKIRNSFENVRLLDDKFLLGVTRMYVGGEFGAFDAEARMVRPANMLTTKKTNFNIALEIIANTHPDAFDENLNGLSAFQIIDMFRSDVSAEKEKNALIGKTDSQYDESESEYTIVPIPDFETSSKYSQYTEPNPGEGGLAQAWCVTKSEWAYNHYTNNGKGIFYFCLRNGFESVERVVGEGHPLDEYGISMIAVSVNEDGSPRTITSRWNHGTTGENFNDSVGAQFTVESLEAIIKRNFNDAFPPRINNGDRRTIEQKLADGESPFDIFDSVKNFSQNFLLVKHGAQYNFVSKITNKLRFNVWATSFNGPDPNGLSIVKFLDGNAILINSDTQNILNDSFENIRPNEDGTAYWVARASGLYNLALPNGNYKFKDWFTESVSLPNGRTKVQREDGMWNILDGDSYLLDDWVSSIITKDAFEQYGYYVAKLKGGDRYYYNLISIESGYFEFMDWVPAEYAMFIGNGCIPMCNDSQDKFNFFNMRTQEVVSDDWFDEIMSSMSARDVNGQNVVCALVRDGATRFYVSIDGAIIRD